eukprot:jgi/Chlat1/8072/Chrsp75S07544
MAVSAATAVFELPAAAGVGLRGRSSPAAAAQPQALRLARVSSVLRGDFAGIASTRDVQTVNFAASSCCSSSSSSSSSRRRTRRTSASAAAGDGDGATATGQVKQYSRLGVGEREQGNSSSSTSTSTTSISKGKGKGKSNSSNNGNGSGGNGSNKNYEAHLTATLPAPCTLIQPGNVHQDLSFLDTADPIDLEPVAVAPPLVKPKRIYSKQTHIVCTLGPSSRTVEQIVELLRAGMGVARFNFSHGSHEYHSETLENLRQACELTGQLCGVLLDTKGPEIRTGMLKGGGPATYTEGSTVTVTTDYTVLGDDATIAITYHQMPALCKPGDKVLIADGSLILQVLETDIMSGSAKCLCLNTATIGERKNCNLPGVDVDLPILTQKDEEDLMWGVKNDVDFVAISFVRCAADVHRVRGALGHAGRGIRLISKVENQEGLRNIDPIIEASDAIMVARGDLGMEVPLEKMFHIQKVIIHKCNIAGKPVITATQMLESMIKNPRPTRQVLLENCLLTAEATDVANAVLDGTDCVMLSGETAAGGYPKEAVQIMASICEESEKSIDNQALAQAMLRSSTTNRKGAMPVIEALASSAVSCASMINAQLIVVLAASGNAARLIAKYRPSCPVVVGVVPRGRARDDIGFKQRDLSGHQVARQCLLTRGLIPVVVTGKSEHLPPPAAAKACVDDAIQYAKSVGLVKPGQLVVTMYNVEQQCAVIRVVPCV